MCVWRAANICLIMWCRLSAAYKKKKRNIQTASCWWPTRSGHIHLSPWLSSCSTLPYHPYVYVSFTSSSYPVNTMKSFTGRRLFTASVWWTALVWFGLFANCKHKYKNTYVCIRAYCCFHFGQKQLNWSQWPNLVSDVRKKGNLTNNKKWSTRTHTPAQFTYALIVMH